MRLRRAQGLLCYWHDGEFVAHPYPEGEPVVVPAVAAEVLSAFGDWRTPQDAAKQLPAYSLEDLTGAVGLLAQHGLLLEEGTPRAVRDEGVARRWDTWAPEAAFFHYGTQREAFSSVSEEQSYELVTRGRPAPFTCYPDADRIMLPRPPARLDSSFGDVLYGRRTHRAFDDRPVPLANLATLLATVFGPTDYIDAKGFGALYRRTSPQGGARQEIEAYVGVRAVTDTAPGWYHYNGREHSLELLAEGCTTAEITALAGGLGWMGGAAFVVVLAAVIDRMKVKYRDPRAYRVCLLNAGHLGQTFVLTATALGLGPFQSGAFHDASLARRLGFDDGATIPLYLVGAGTPTDPPYPAARKHAGLDAFRRTTLA